MRSDPSKPWFAPKRYGYGAGLPIAWQGWAVLGIYMLVTVGAAIILPVMFPNPALCLPAILIVVTIATPAMMVIAARKTKGGWRWRSGEDE